MFGEKEEILKNDKMLFQIHADIFGEKKYGFEDKLKNILGKEWKVHFSKEIPNKLIKKTLKSRGISCDYLHENTDSGLDIVSETDGGVTYIDSGDITIPLVWVEGKSSYSVSKGKGRGQASGLITEQYSRVNNWTKILNNQIFPLVAFCYGTDFNANLGGYNIGRIASDLCTNGNCNPYEKGYTLSSWFYYQQSFTREEVEKNITLAMDANFQKLIEIITKEKEKYIFA